MIAEQPHTQVLNRENVLHFSVQYRVRHLRKENEKLDSDWFVSYGSCSWVSHDIINFTGGQLQIDTLSSDCKKFSLYVLTLCLAANVSNFVRFACSSAVQSSIHFGLTPTQNY